MNSLIDSDLTAFKCLLGIEARFNKVAFFLLLCRWIQREVSDSCGKGSKKGVWKVKFGIPKVAKSLEKGQGLQ